MVVGWVGLLLGAACFMWLFTTFVLPRGFFSSLAVLEGGMSFHGAMIGSLLAVMLIARKKKQSATYGYDSLFCALVLGFGHVANFINGELAGRPSDVPWAVVFPRLYDQIPRHPSQLQALGEGFLLYLLLMMQKRGLRSQGLYQRSF